MFLIVFAVFKFVLDKQRVLVMDDVALLESEL